MMPFPKRTTFSRLVLCRAFVLSLGLIALHPLVVQAQPGNNQSDGTGAVEVPTGATAPEVGGLLVDQIGEIADILGDALDELPPDIPTGNTEVYLENIRTALEDLLESAEFAINNAQDVALEKLKGKSVDCGGGSIAYLDGISGWGVGPIEVTVFQEAPFICSCDVALEDLEEVEERIEITFRGDGREIFFEINTLIVTVMDARESIRRMLDRAHELIGEKLLSRAQAGEIVGFMEEVVNRHKDMSEFFIYVKELIEKAK